MAGVPQSEFLKLFLKHESALKAYLRSLLRNMDAVDDVLQSASVIMWQKMDQLREEEGFLPWAKVIVRYESMAYRRNHARDRLVFDDQLIDLLARESEKETDQFEAEKAALKICIQTLRPEYQELVMAPYLGRDRVKLLAERSRRTVNSLYKQLGRLRLRLRGCVQQKLEEAAI